MVEPQCWRLRPNAPADHSALIAVSAVREGEAVKLVRGSGGSVFSALILRHDGQRRANLKLCPHFSLPLVIDEGLFSRDRRRIRCLHHFAEFDPATGDCIGGACEGSGLEPIRVYTGADGILRVAAPAEPDNNDDGNV